MRWSWGVGHMAHRCFKTESRDHLKLYGTSTCGHCVVMVAMSSWQCRGTACVARHGAALCVCAVRFRVG
jgi:hypothetical protein